MIRIALFVAAAAFILSLFKLPIRMTFTKEQQTEPVRYRLNFTYRPVRISWYGESAKDCLGCRADRVMACGGVFDENAYTVAVPVQKGRMMSPCGTVVQFKNGNRSVEAIVADSGGFGKYGRQFDVSKAVFRELAPLDAGVVTVNAAW